MVAFYNQTIAVCASKSHVRNTAKSRILLGTMMVASLLVILIADSTKASVDYEQLTATLYSLGIANRHFPSDVNRSHSTKQMKGKIFFMPFLA